ncbi:hypothetical protein DEI84_00915 [Curtobacterium sp. MCBD17_023]|nr:hypothetical protein DEI84_00915 [Curtobacterium sp. MCBD17_023]
MAGSLAARSRPGSVGGALPEVDGVTDLRAAQREVTALVLRTVGGQGFVLAGSGAIREHGLVDRPTRDIDLFTDRYDRELFRTAVEDAVGVLSGHGYRVDVRRHDELFAQLLVTSAQGDRVEMDLGYDWRGHAPADLPIGPVLAADDAVASKLDALYGRLEVRDFIDVDAIRASGRWTDADLLRLVAERDDGYDPVVFAQQLRLVTRVADDRFAEYGVAPPEVAALRQRALAWAGELEDETGGQPAGANR